MAKLKQERSFRIKVGSAIGDPIERIYQQFSGNRTALSEPAVVLLLFQTQGARHLESWLHKQLAPASDAGGSEWFHTSPDELVQLYQVYLHKKPCAPPDNVNPRADSVRQERRVPTQRREARALHPLIEAFRVINPTTGRLISSLSAKDHAIMALLKARPMTRDEIVEALQPLGVSPSKVDGLVKWELSKDRIFSDDQDRLIVKRSANYRLPHDVAAKALVEATRASESSGE